MPSGFSLPKLSFRWQIILLGAVVFVLFIAVLMGTLGALQYTKSAVLSNEKRRLSEASNDLARDYMNKAKSASQARGLSSVDLNSISSREATSEISQSALQKLDGIGGGFTEAMANWSLATLLQPAMEAANSPFPEQIPRKCRPQFYK